jgi:hypothetical protein
MGGMFSLRCGLNFKQYLSFGFSCIFKTVQRPFNFFPRHFHLQRSHRRCVLFVEGISRVHIQKYMPSGVILHISVSTVSNRLMMCRNKATDGLTDSRRRNIVKKLSKSDSTLFITKSD